MASAIFTALKGLLELIGMLTADEADKFREMLRKDHKIGDTLPEDVASAIDAHLPRKK